MRRAALILLLALAAGCGGDGAAETTQAVEDDTRPPGRVLLAFVEAAAEGDAEGMWELLSSDSRERFGGSLEAFREGSAAQIQADAGALGGAGEPRLVLEEALGADLAVATAAAGDAAYAAPLWLEQAGWRVSVGGGPQLVPRAPEPGATVADVDTVALGVSTTEVDEAVVWIDETSVPGLVLEADGSVTGTPGASLEPGTHVATALAVATGEAAATAWTFEAG